jgi:hypothetical protein
MTMTPTEQLALKHCVSMPETCKALDWKEKTLFYWIISKRTGECDVFYAKHHTFTQGFEIDFDIIPAPSIGDLFNALPESILQRIEINFKDSCIFYNKGLLNLENVVFVFFKGTDITQALAEMYILLKEKGLLPTT